MLKLTWKQLQDNAFISTMVRLNNSRDLDSTTAYRVGRFCQTASKTMDTVNKKYMEIHLAHAAKKVVDGKEVPETDEKGELIYNAPDAKAKADAEFQKLAEETTVEIKVHKLDFTKLKGLAGLEYSAIEHVCDNVPDIA